MEDRKGTGSGRKRNREKGEPGEGAPGEERRGGEGKREERRRGAAEERRQGAGVGGGAGRRSAREAEN